MPPYAHPDLQQRVGLARVGLAGQSGIAREAQPLFQGVRARLEEPARDDKGAVHVVVVALQLDGKAGAVLSSVLRRHLHREVLLVEGKVLELELLLEGAGALAREADHHRVVAGRVEVDLEPSLGLAGLGEVAKVEARREEPLPVQAGEV